jgi:hypothetical protein
VYPVGAELGTQSHLAWDSNLMIYQDNMAGVSRTHHNELRLSPKNAQPVACRGRASCFMASNIFAALCTVLRKFYLYILLNSKHLAERSSISGIPSPKLSWLLSQLTPNKIVVSSSLLYKLIVCSRFDQFPISNHRNAVGVSNGLQLVCDHNDSAVISK